jgi:TPR repeat protein
MMMLAPSKLYRIAGGHLLFLLMLLLATSPAWSGPETEEAPKKPETFAAILSRAEAGDVKSQCDVGIAYLNGSKVSQDFQKGLAWLYRASDGGFGYARLVLADAYSRGYAGVPVDDEKTYYFASLAAASSALPEKYRERAVKLRDASAKRLTSSKVAGLQAKAALAPLDAAVSY